VLILLVVKEAVRKRTHLKTITNMSPVPTSRPCQERPRTMGRKRKTCRKRETTQIAAETTAGLGGEGESQIF